MVYSPFPAHKKRPDLASLGGPLTSSETELTVSYERKYTLDPGFCQWLGGASFESREGLRSSRPPLGQGERSDWGLMETKRWKMGGENEAEGTCGRLVWRKGPRVERTRKCRGGEQGAKTRGRRAKEAGQREAFLPGDVVSKERSALRGQGYSRAAAVASRMRRAKVVNVSKVSAMKRVAVLRGRL